MNDDYIFSKHVCYVTIILLSGKLQLTYKLHVTLCLLGILFILVKILYC